MYVVRRRELRVWRSGIACRSQSLLPSWSDSVVRLSECLYLPGHLSSPWFCFVAGDRISSQCGRPHTCYPKL